MVSAASLFVNVHTSGVLLADRQIKWHYQLNKSICVIEYCLQLLGLGWGMVRHALGGDLHANA